MMRQFRRETLAMITRGAHLSLDEVSALLDRITKFPADREARLALLGAHIAPSEVRGLQALWFIQYEPWTSIGMYIVNLDRSLHQHDIAAKLWSDAVARHPMDLRVFENAVWFFAGNDSSHAVRLLDDRIASSLRDADTWELAAIVFEFIASAEPAHAEKWLLRSLDAAYNSFAEDDRPERRLDLLLCMRAAASRIQRFQQLRLLDLASSAHHDTRDSPGAVRRQAASVAVGFVALANGNHERALCHLSNSLQASCASEYAHSLADVLARQGFQKETSEILRAAHDLWLENARALKAWLVEVDDLPLAKE